MNTPLDAVSRHAAAGTAVVTWKQPVMALLVCLLFGPIFGVPLVALVWAFGGLLSLTPDVIRIAEIAAVVVAAAPTAWLARRGWVGEGRMALGMDP